jgi:hypothetical protein
MSLSRLANEDVSRSVSRSNPAAAAAAGQPSKDDRFDLLTKYIPTETLTLYVAAMAAEPAISASFNGKIEALELYIAGAVLTPLVLLLAAYGKLRASGLATSFRPHPWPYAAALVAFLIWALSIPGLLENDHQRIVAGFGALFVSTFLALLETALGPK